MKVNHSHIVLDACCILNFCASENLISILKSIPVEVVVTEVVKERELITLKYLENGENDDAISFELAIRQGLISVVDFDSELEEEAFLNYSFELGDDGESATGAIAIHRNWAIATDDKRAISFFKREAPQIQIISTLEIIKHWAEASTLSSTQLASVLGSIRNKGRYMPHRDHPLMSWWNKSI
jgi:hypothetical protein